MVYPVGFPVEDMRSFMADLLSVARNWAPHQMVAGFGIASLVAGSGQHLVISPAALMRELRSGDI
jgi:hypothetical protein